MTTKAQINALICDYLDRNYNNLDDFLPALKKLLKLTNRTKPFGKLEEIVSAFKKADQNNKRKHDNNEDGQSAKKSRDNIVTSDNLTLPDIIESSTESSDIIARVAGNRRASSSLNKDKNETISITSPSQDRRESNEIQGIGKSLLSDEDGIILCIRSINKNIDDCYHDGTAEVLSEQEDDNLITKVKSLRPAVSTRASKTAAKLASSGASPLASGSDSSMPQPMQNQFKTSVSKKLHSKTKKKNKVSPNSKNASCDSADEEIFMEEAPKSTVNSVNKQIFDKKVPEKQTDSKSGNVVKSPLKVSNEKSSDAKSTKNKPTTRADSKSLPIVKTTTQPPKETSVNYDSDSSQWSIDGEEVQPIKLTKNLKPSKIVTNDVCEANKSRTRANPDERDVNIPRINIESDNNSVPISSGDSLTSKQAKTTQSPSKTDLISKSTDVSSDSPPVAKVVIDSFNSNRTEHSTSENNAKKSVNKSTKPTIATVRNEPPKGAPSTSSDSDDDVQLPTTPEKYSLEQIKITALSPTKGNTRIVTEIFTRAQQSSKSQKKSPHNEPASKAKTADNNKTTTKPLNKNDKCNAQKMKHVPKVQQKTYDTPKTKSSTRAALKGKTKPLEGDFSDKEENFPTARYKPLAMKTNVADTSSNAKNVTKMNMDSKLTTTSDTSKDVTVGKRDLESNHSNESGGDVSLKQKTSEPSSGQINQNTNYHPDNDPALPSTDNDSSVPSSSLEKDKSNIKSNNAKITSISTNSKIVVPQKPSAKDTPKTKPLTRAALKGKTKPPEGDFSDKEENFPTARYKPLAMKTNVADTSSNAKNVTKLNMDSKLTTTSDTSKDVTVGKRDLESNHSNESDGEVSLKQKTSEPSSGQIPQKKYQSENAPSQNPAQASPDNDFSVHSSLEKEKIKSNDTKIAVLANSKSVVAKKPSTNTPDNDSSDFSSSDEDESDVKSNEAKITANDPTTSFSTNSKSVVPQKPSAKSSDNDSSSDEGEGNVKSNKEKITVKNPTTPILANSKSIVTQKTSVSSPDSDSSDSSSSDDDVKSIKEKITVKNPTTSISANSKSKVPPKPSVNPPDTDSSELTSSDEDESDVKANKEKITVTNFTTSVSANSKSVVPQKPSANPSDSSELTSSDEDENYAKSRKAKITINNPTTSISANSKSKVPPKPSASPPDTDSSELTSSDEDESNAKSNKEKITVNNYTTSVSANSKSVVPQKPSTNSPDNDSSDLSSSDDDEINIKSNNANKFSTSVSANSKSTVSANSKSTVSHKPTLESPDSSSSSNLTSDDIMKSKVTKTSNTIPSTPISGNLESPANKSILNNEDLSVMKKRKSPPTTKSTSNNLPLLITNRSGKIASPLSKTKKTPKSSEFIDSDSSDEDFANPPLPINNATSKISIISQLPPKVTKLSTLSSKPSHKSMLNLESDLSLESSDEEEDMKVISEAVARSAKKALVSNKPKLPEKTIVASVPRPALKATSSDSSSSDEDDKPTINKTKPITNIKKDKILSGNTQANVGLIKNVSNVIKDIKGGESSLSDFLSDSESELSEKISKDSKASNPSKTGDNSNAVLQKTLEDVSSSSDSIDIKTPTLQPANSESLMFSSLSPDKQSKKTDLLNFTLSGLDNDKKANDSEDIQNCVVRALNILTREEEEMRHAQHIKGQNNSDGRLNNQSDSNAMIKIKTSMQELNSSESSSDGDSNRPVVKARTQITKAAATNALLSSDDGDNAREIPCARPVKTSKVTKSNKKPIEETSKRFSDISDGSSLDEFKEPLSKKTKQDHASLTPSKTSTLILKAKSKTKSTKINSKSKMENEEFKASNKKTKNVKAVSKNRTKDTKQEPVPKHDLGVVVKSNKNVKTLNYSLQNDDSSSDDSSRQKSSDIVKSNVTEKSSNNAKLASKTQTSAKANKNNLVEVNTTEPSKLKETLSSNSRKRKPSTSNVLIQKDDKNETKTFPGGKQLKRHQSSSESSDEEEEEIPSPNLNLKKKSRTEYISDMLRNGRGGAIASTPKSRAVRLNTPNASIIRPTDGKKMNDHTNDSLFKDNSLPGKTFHGQVTRKQRSSSESSSDLSSD